MNQLDRQSSVGAFVTDQPGRARIFEQFGIDYCCGGKQSLEQACTQKGLNPEMVLNELLAYTGRNSMPTAGDEANWSRKTLTALVDHIEETHHSYLCRELPRLAELAKKVATVHGERHPELVELQEIFAAFRTELDLHMAKEEQVLFPIVRQMEETGETSFHCGSVQNPIRVMEYEHDRAGQALEAMRALTNN